MKLYVDAGNTRLKWRLEEAGEDVGEWGSDGGRRDRKAEGSDRQVVG